MRKHVELWLEGWRLGDAGMVLSAVTDDFVHDDPVDGRLGKAEFAAYIEELFATEATPEGFQTIGDVMTLDAAGEETVWAWWRTLAAPMEGAALVRARADGVYLHRVAYYGRSRV